MCWTLPCGRRSGGNAAGSLAQRRRPGASWRLSLLNLTPNSNTRPSRSLGGIRFRCCRCCSRCRCSFRARRGRARVPLRLRPQNGPLRRELCRRVQLLPHVDGAASGLRLPRGEPGVRGETETETGCRGAGKEENWGGTLVVLSFFSRSCFHWRFPFRTASRTSTSTLTTPTPLNQTKRPTYLDLGVPARASKRHVVVPGPQRRRRWRWRQ